MKTGGETERVQVFVRQNSTGKMVVKEVFLVSGRIQNFEIDLDGFGSGSYSVKVISPSIRAASLFKKK